MTTPSEIVESITARIEDGPAEEKNESQETSDINIATFIKFVKGVETCGYRFAGEQLRIRFKITEQQLIDFKEEYLNSPYALYDATKRNFLRLLKRSGHK